jgi:hypothetical protein
MAGVARDHCLAPARSVDEATAYGGRYQRLFPDLPRLHGDEAALRALGVEGGWCDCGAQDADDDAAGAAGWPFFGQYIAHDITADRSALASQADEAEIRNYRTPKANLEPLYGVGPVGEPFLYERDDPARLLLDGHDLPRNPEGMALAGDPRQDVHLLINQLQVALARVHNGIVERLREDGTDEDALFAEAQRATRWHYQWVVLNDFLPRLCGVAVVRDVLDHGPRHYRPDAGEVYIPYEFADAAFRYGHSQIRRTYRLTAGGDRYALLPDLVGFGPVPAERAVDWAQLFDLPGSPPAQRAKRIDGRLPPSLIALPVAITGHVDVPEYHSLAVRDLQRGQALGLPSGEAVASVVGEEPLTVDEVGLGDDWAGETPLWLYLLREGDVRADGDALGPVGGRIVAEVLVGIVDDDPASYRSVDPSWRPTLPAAQDGSIGLADLLVFSAASAGA